MKTEIEREIKKEENFIKLETKKTNFSKMAFINEIKNGLGDEIKKSTTPITPIKQVKNKENFIKKVYKYIKSWITKN